MKYFLIAGELSGDMHGADMMESILQYDVEAKFYGVGGPLMQAKGLSTVFPIESLNVMGLWEVIKRLPSLLRIIRIVKAYILDVSPDVVVLIDYPGMNLRLAKWLHHQTIFPVAYYILPKAWAWKQGRAAQIKEYVDLALSILPFEKEFYQSHGVEVIYVGNPSQRYVADFLASYPTTTKPQTIALLPGSRMQEVNHILPVMVEAASKLTQYHYIVTAVRHIDATLYARHLEGKVSYELRYDFYEALAGCEAAVVASGTATLETALLGIPQVAVYKMNPVTYYFAKRWVKLQYITLVNLIAGQKLIEELLQKDCSPDRIAASIKSLMSMTAMDRKQMYEPLYHRLEVPSDDKSLGRKIVILAQKKRK